MIESNLALVARLVRERLAKVPGHVRSDELMSAGRMALVLSAQSYDPDRGVPFEYFAATRIRGALLDELRGMDWATRSVRGRAREVESVRGRLASILDRIPRMDEVAEAMHVSTGELDSLQSDLARANVLSLQGLAAGIIGHLPYETCSGPESLILQRETLGYLHDAIAELSDRLRFIVVAYFFDQRQMSDIAAELAVSPARISQLCTEAVRQLRDGMNSQLNPSAVGKDTQSTRSAAVQTAYFAAIASRGTISSRLAMSSSRGDMLSGAGISSAGSAVGISRAESA
ncbi:MAG: sigma-70 family RNA polymerase sigma factor [Actinomycetota bacterium]|nr:sigma-70 family RNA polymerase sigma factor [Actinomycetota bacterium]